MTGQNSEYFLNQFFFLNQYHSSFLIHTETFLIFTKRQFGTRLIYQREGLNVECGLPLCPCPLISPQRVSKYVRMP